MTFPGRPGLLGAGVALLGAVVGGCVHYNAVFNAGQIFDAVENARLAAPDSGLGARYEEVIVRARRGLEADPDGAWADDALLVIGQAHLRRHELLEAREALEEALRITRDDRVRKAATVYLGAVEIEGGELAAGLRRLAIVPEVRVRLVRGEGYLWRARALLRTGFTVEAWRSVTEAERAHPWFEVPADLLRLEWGVSRGDTTAAFEGIQALMRESRARGYGDSIRGVLERVAEVWGPSRTVSLMSGATEAAWSRTERDALMLLRARLAHQADDTVTAFDDAGTVAGGVGPVADEARVQMARWRLAAVTQLGQLPETRALLLPAVDDADAVELLNAIRRVEFLVDAALAGANTSFFAAAEQARSVLGAGPLASSLYVAYADGEGEGDWAGKALLAARDLAAEAERRNVIERRLAGLPDDAYVRYARTGIADPELGVLEERLQSTLDDVLGRVEQELRQRRLLIPGPGGAPPD